jgi:O-antigen/teichoic acid export membrane protein
MRYLIVLFMPICFIIAGCSSEIIDFLFTSKYIEATKSLMVLCPAVVFAGLLLLSLSLIDATDRPEVSLSIIYGLLIVSGVLNVLLVPQLSILGAALASLITFCVGASTGIYLVYRFIEVLPPLFTVVRCSFAGLLVYVLSQLWPTSSWLLIGKLMALSLLYVAILFLVGELNRGDMSKIWHGFLK